MVNICYSVAQITTVLFIHFLQAFTNWPVFLMAMYVYRMKFPGLYFVSCSISANCARASLFCLKDEKYLNLGPMVHLGSSFVCE